MARALETPKGVDTIDTGSLQMVPVDTSAETHFCPRGNSVGWELAPRGQVRSECYEKRKALSTEFPDPRLWIWFRADFLNSRQDSRLRPLRSGGYFVHRNLASVNRHEPSGKDTASTDSEIHADESKGSDVHRDA